ncbi:MAG: amidohydrolase family protein, partial [Pseudomonadota bacterium]
DRFAALKDAAGRHVSALGSDAAAGVAPHSLRAVTREGLAAAARLAGDDPIHIHVAEQTAEVDELLASYGARPVEWLMANADVGRNWCLIHLTQMTAAETEATARSGAVAGLCPITESNLGDGIFDGVDYLAHGGAFGVGSDSNVRISLSEELRTLEYSQRLRDRSRAALATAGASIGRTLFEGAAHGGARALGRASGRIAPGLWADLAALDAGALALEGAEGDAALDAWIFAVDDRLVTDVWSAGRHVVRGGRHVARDAVEARYRGVIRALADRL